MKGDVARQQAILPVAPVQFLHDRPKHRLPAADDGAGWRVLAGDLHARRRVFAGPEGNLQRLEQFLHPRAVEADGQHAPGTGGALLQHRAMEDQTRRVRQRKRAACVGGGHLAGAVTDDAVRVDAACPEPFYQGALDHEDDGLSEPDFVERFLRSGEAGLAQREVRVLPPVCLGGIDRAAKDGLGIVERTPATRPLRALSGEHHGQPGFSLLYRGNRRGVVHEGVQSLDQRLPAVNRKGGAGGKVGAPAAEIAGQGIEVQLSLPKRLPQLPRALHQRAGRTRRQGNHESGPRCQRHRPDPWLRRTVFPYHAVPVGTPEPERIDAEGDGAIGERLALGLHVHGATLEVDLRVRHQEVPRDRRKGAPLHHQED